MILNHSMHVSLAILLVLSLQNLKNNYFNFARQLILKRHFVNGHNTQ
jgi:hypothetical protein